MTGQEIYEIASSFLYERDGDDSDSKHFAVNFINILLQEALPYENSNRLADGAEELIEAPFIASLADTIPYVDSITRTAIPYGLASFFFQEAMDTFQAENYRNKYLGALADASKYSFTTIIDAYGEE